MAYTYSKIASVTVGSGGVSSIDFLAIPQNYTDLMILVSAKTNRAQTGDNLWLRFNGDSSSSYYTRRIYSTGSGTTGSDTGGTSTWINVLEVGDSGPNTANTFGSASVYISNYTGSNYKAVSADAAPEANQLEVYIGLQAGLWAKSNPVTSITLAPQIGPLITQYSTATLYGIKAEV